MILGLHGATLKKLYFGCGLAGLLDTPHLEFPPSPKNF